MIFKIITAIVVTSLVIAALFMGYFFSVGCHRWYIQKEIDEKGSHYWYWENKRYYVLRDEGENGQPPPN